MDEKKNPYLEKVAALGDSDMHYARSRVNRHRESQGLKKIDLDEFQDEFKATRGIGRRVVGTALGTIAPGLGNVIGYYLGKSRDNVSAAKRIVKSYEVEKSASEKKRDDVHGWKRAGVVAGTSTAIGLGQTQANKHLSNLSQRSMAKGTSITESDVSSYRKAKNLRHVVRHKEGGLGSAFFTPAGVKAPIFGKNSKPQVNASHPTAALHEYGHAHSHNNARKKFGKSFAKARFGSYVGSNQLTMMASGLAGAYAATSDNEKVRKYAPAAVGAAAVPMLAEEARATLSPAKHLLKTRGKKVAGQFVKQMAPAYGTYGVLAGGVVGAASWAKHIKNKSVNKANKGA